MGTLETFDHTADVGLRITGVDLDDLFETAARGVVGYMVANLDAVRPEHREPVHLEADEPADLLAAWLGELVFRCETRHRLYGEFSVRVSDNGRVLDGTIAGEAIAPDRHQLDHEVKAVTRHGLALERDASGWTAEVILDI